MLDAEQVERYRWDGYLFPLPALAPMNWRAIRASYLR